VKRRPSIERIAPRPEAALEPKILERQRQRQRLDQPAYLFELVRVDSAKLIAFPRWHEGTAFGPVQTELREQALDIEPRRCQYARELADTRSTGLGNAAGVAFWFQRGVGYHSFGMQGIGSGETDFGRNQRDQL